MQSLFEFEDQDLRGKDLRAWKCGLGLESMGLRSWISERVGRSRVGGSGSQRQKLESLELWI